MAIYVGQTGDGPGQVDPGRRWAPASGCTGWTTTAARTRTPSPRSRSRPTPCTPAYIPYTDRPIAWHTDGYYNTPERQIHAVLLHCVHPAATGGANALLDHEIAYCLVRDRDPEFIRALMHPRCMTIPANPGDTGGDGNQGGELRAEQSGPVFSVRPDGRLHMRYTNRARNIQWRDDPLTAAAVDCLKTILHTPSPWHLEGRLEPGWGLICNNVLHTRTGFTDGPVPRLLYRARYYDRIVGT